MQSLPNLLKLNAFQNVKKLDFTTMSLDELKAQSRKFENLSKDTKLVNSLPDKGAKINEQLKLLQELIAKKSSSSEQKDEVNPNPVEELSEKLESLTAGEKESKEEEEEVKREINYFEKMKYASSSTKNASKIDMDKYKQVKEKILKKTEPVGEVRKTKPISIEECVKLLKEQEKTVQEFQMKMASEFLTKNQSETYNYLFAEQELGENGLKYRENREEEQAEDDSEEEEEKDFFENVD